MFHRTVLTLGLAAFAATPARVPARQRPATQPPTLEELESRARQDSLDPDAHFRLAQRSYRLNRLNDDPMVDFRVAGAKAPAEDMVVVPEYGRYTTEYMLWFGLGPGEGNH